MTGLTEQGESHHIATPNEKTQSLLYSAEINEWIKKKHYNTLGDSPARIIALNKSGIMNWFRKWKKWCIVFCVLGLFLVGIGSVLSGVKWFAKHPIVKGLSAVLVVLYFIGQHILKIITIIPASNVKLIHLHEEWCKDILMGKEHDPKWIKETINSEAFPNVSTGGADQTMRNNHVKVVDDSTIVGEDKIWKDMHRHSSQFLRLWGRQTKSESLNRALISLWAFNPPVETIHWGDLRLKLIDYAQKEFAQQIRTLIEDMEKLSMRDKALKLWSENNYSFEWLSEQLSMSKNPKVNPTLRVLHKWVQLQAQ